MGLFVSHASLLLFFLLPLSFLSSSYCHGARGFGEGSGSGSESLGGGGGRGERNCTNSFTVLEESLLSSETNRFNLLKAFYPPRNALPVFQTVTYNFESETVNQSKVWYWAQSEVFLVQPLDVLQFTSLFHSNLQYRVGDLELMLPGDCLETKNEFIEILTERLKLYAQTQRVSTMSEPLRVSDLYLAVAASREEITSGGFQSVFAGIWLHLVFLLFPVSTVIVVYTCDPIQLLLGDKTLQKLRDASSHPRLAAMIQMSVVFTVFVVVMDFFAFARTLSSEIYSDHTKSGFYLTTLTGFMVDLAAFLWIGFVMVTSCQWDSTSLSLLHRGRLRGKLTSTRIHTLLVSVTASPLLCGANHFPYIILSYVSDPYHAGSISIVYFISFFLFYFIFSQVYARFVLRTGSRPKNFPYSVNADLVRYPEGDACRRKVRVPFNIRVVLLSLGIVTPLLVFYEGLLIVLFWALPIRKTLEDSPTRLYTTYQGTGILIAALLTYNIVLRPSPFSLAGAFDKLGKQLQIPQKIGRKWVRMGDEEKAAFVIRTLFATRGKIGSTSAGENDEEEEEMDTGNEMEVETGNEIDNDEQEVPSVNYNKEEVVMSSSAVIVGPDRGADEVPPMSPERRGVAYHHRNKPRIEAMNSINDGNYNNDNENAAVDHHHKTISKESTI